MDDGWRGTRMTTLSDVDPCFVCMHVSCASMYVLIACMYVCIIIIINDTLARSLEPLSNPWSQSARSIPSVPKIKLMASRHQKKNTRTRRRGDLYYHGVRKKGLSNYSSTNPLKSKFRRATSDYLDTALLLRCCIHELPAVTIRKMPSRRQCGNGISHAESSQ